MTISAPLHDTQYWEVLFRNITKRLSSRILLVNTEMDEIAIC
jgi:hypothetical protein